MYILYPVVCDFKVGVSEFSGNSVNSVRERN